MGDLIDKLVTLVDDIDLASLFPAMDTVLGWTTLIARICILAAPLVMLVLGLRYRFLPPAEANYKTGYRFFFGMGSDHAWLYTQRLAGIVWTVLGAVMTLAMLVAGLLFGKMDPMAAANAVLICVGIQLALIVVSCLVINIVVSVKFDKDGNPRS